MVEDSDSHDDVPERPSAEALAPMAKVLAPLRQLIKPKFYGLEHVPKQHALLVGNHTLYGILDLLLLYAELGDRGIVPRALADHAHFRVPGVRQLMTTAGAVPGTRAKPASSCSAATSSWSSPAADAKSRSAKVSNINSSGRTARASR